MQTKICAAALVLSTTACTTLPDMSSMSPQVKGALGAAAGGIVGNQVGAGRGKTAATAAGAAIGVVLASDCKVGVGTVAGGALGGLLGSQVGKGNGKNAMAGLGAALGAWLGSDCSPAANPAKPEPIANMAPVMINGLQATPMTGFSPEAFSGLPPIVTPQDIHTAGSAVKMFADMARQAQADGNTELALISMYWAKRISDVTLSVLTASLQSITTNQGMTATIPAKALVILPAFNQHRPETDMVQALIDEFVPQAAAYPTQAVLVADNGGFAAGLNALKNLTALPPGQRNAPAPTANTPSLSAMQQLSGFPKNVVLRLPDGTQVMKTDDALTVYNPNDRPITLPLEKLDFMPRTAVPSAARQAAANLMFTIRENHMSWVFNTYKTQTMGFDTIAKAPNALADLYKSGRTVAYFSEAGGIDMSPISGAQAYKTHPTFKRAMDTLDAVDKPTTPVRAHVHKCMGSGYSSFTVLSGKYANQIQSKCFTGTFSAPRVFSTQTFFISEGKEIVQTMESLMRDKEIQKLMKQSLAEGEAASNLLSLAPGVGNVESGLQCVGTYTLAQYGAVAKEFGTTDVIRSFDVAKLSGWTPPAPEGWSFNRIANCVGAIPLLGTTARGVKGASKVAAMSGANVTAGLPRLDTMKNLVAAFETPTTFNQFVKGVSDAGQLVPGNPAAAGFVKAMYDMVMSGQNMSQTFASIEFFNG